MKIKINRYEFDVTNKDYILDNTACYQCMTCKHRIYETRYMIPRDVATVMAQKQFKQLVKENKIVRHEKEDLFIKKYHWGGCKVWRFNVDDIEGNDDE